MKQANRSPGAVLRNMGTSSTEVRETTSGKDGSFKLENVYSGSAGPEVMVRAKKFSPLRLSVRPGPAEKPAEVNITLEAGHRQNPGRRRRRSRAPSCRRDRLLRRRLSAVRQRRS